MERRALLRLSVGGCAIIAGCASPNPRLYTLAPVPGTPRSGTPRIVVLHQVSIARYLDRPEIVRSSENYRIGVMANDMWGEPLAAMIKRVLTENLSQRLPGTTFLNSSGAITAEEEASIEINIDRMDMDANRSLAFAAQADVIFKNGHRQAGPKNFRTSVPVSADTIGAEVQAMSIALGQFADQIADMLREPVATRRRR